MRFEISKDFHLSYSHQLRGVPEGHKCGRVHGHNAVVRVVLGGDELDSTGFVVDYGAMHPIKTWLNETFDHRHVNDVVAFNPTAEELAREVCYVVSDLGFPVVRVGWSETPNTWAWFDLNAESAGHISRPQDKT